MAEHHPLGDIEYLRETLLKSYRPGFPILKELIQNAEDANSTHLDYGWVEGISDAEHPLLRLPALFFLNNGDFTDNNAKSIRYIIGASSKPNQEGAIGKFGLGLKSVFHLCEAFFYLAPDLENSNYKRCSIFNPWADASGKDEFHKGWDNFSKQDQSRIKECLREILAKEAYKDKRFILWIPLRQPEHRTLEDEYKDDGIELGYIVKDFFQDVPKFLSEENIEHKIGSLLFLLHSLSNICYWERNNKKFHIDLSDAKRQGFSVLQENTENPLKGTITLNQEKLFEYSGHEIVFSTQLFQDILISPDLPRKFKTIKPHGGVVFSTKSRSSSNQSGTKSESYFNICTAVFLPIGEEKNILCESENDYSLILHGYFFVDSGRTGILGLDQKELTFTSASSNDSKDDLLKRDWNLELYNNLLKRLLYGINRFVSELKISELEVSAICTSLLESNLFKQDNNRERICKEKQWIYRVRPNAIEWILLDAQERVLSVPKPQEKVFTQIWQVFSGLANIAETTCLSLPSKPNLRASRKMNDWHEDEIRKILKSVNARDVFGDRVYISYLVSLLKGCDSKCIREVQEELCLLARQAFRCLGHENLRQQSSIQAFIDLIDSKRRFSIDCNDVLIQKEVYELDLQVLIVPKFDLAKNDTQLGYGDAKELLECIARIQINQSNLHTVISLTKQILKAASQHISQVLDINSCLKFIVGYDCRARQCKFFSPERLNAVRQLGTLFKVSQSNELTTALQEALPSNIIVLIERDIADLLYGKNSIMPCDQQTCLQVLKRCPKLGFPDQRLNLLGRLLQNV